MPATDLKLDTRIASGAEESPGLIQEHAWRSPLAGPMRKAVSGRLLVTRWRDRRADAHRHIAAATECAVIALCLEAVGARITGGGAAWHAGLLAPGALFLIPPGQPLVAEFDGPCDFLHTYLAPDAWRRRADEFLGADSQEPAGRIRVIRDGLAEQLARSLLKTSNAAQHAYEDAVANAIAVRYLLLTRTAGPAALALPRWRLRRVQTHVEENLAEPLRLAELASVAGLSRMHFAAQFRAATGYRPHEYLLWRRIERAKAMLREPESPVVQVALEVGFQAQAHFTTVFKRLTGDTPANWRVAQRADAASALTS